MMTSRAAFPFTCLYTGFKQTKKRAFSANSAPTRHVQELRYTTTANHAHEPCDTPARHAQKYYGTSSPCAGTSPMSVVFLLAPVSVTEFERSHSQPSFGSDQL